MMKIAKFEKVSFEQFEKDWLKNFPDTNDVKAVYDSIKLPKRATNGTSLVMTHSTADFLTSAHT